MVPLMRLIGSGARGGERGEMGSMVGSPRESGLFCALKVESSIKPSRISTHLSATGPATLRSRPNAPAAGAVGGGEDNEKGKVGKSADSPLRLHMT